jgi:hypothetical protein
METQSQASISALVNSAIADGQTLVKQQIELAKAEMSTSAKHAAATSGMFIGAGVLGFLAFVFALVAGAYGIVAAGLPVWAGFLIVAGSLLLIAAILGLVGRAQSKKVKGPARAMAQMEQTKAALSGGHATTAAPGSAPVLSTGSAVSTP